MALEKVRELPITGFSANRVELVEIPSSLPIRELRFDVHLQDSDGGWTVTGDPFNLVFQYIELLFDGDKQYRIDSYAKLQAISLIHTGKKAEITVIDDSNASPQEDVRLRFKLPVFWTPNIGVQKPQIRFQYVNTSGLTSQLMRIQYVHTTDTSNFQRFKYEAVPQTTSSGGTLQFKPDNGAIVRGAFIFNVDNSATFTAGGYLALNQMGGANGISEITLEHKGVEYWQDASERDILHHMYEVFPLISRLGLYDDLGVERTIWGNSPFTYEYESADVGGDGIPPDATTVDYAGLNPFLYVSFEDIKVDVNTVLRIVSDTGTYASGDQIEVFWVYTQKSSSEKAK